MKTIAFMFSGQGSQYKGMGKEFYDEFESYRKIIKKSELVTGYPIEKISFDNDQRLNQTKYTQVCMFTMYAGILEILKEKNIDTDTSMGLSLGEYGAYLHQGVFDFETGLKIIQKRALLMEKASKENPGSMCAVIGMDLEVLNDLIEKSQNYVTIANYNTPKQLVISGESQAVSELAQTIKTDYNKRAIMLNTSGAFHSQLMAEAKVSFEAFIKNQVIQQPKGHLWLNTSGQEYNKDIQQHMANQLTHSVKFYQMVEGLIDQGIDTFIEIGPKRTLSQMVKKINREVNVFNIEDLESLKTTQTYMEERHENLSK